MNTQAQIEQKLHDVYPFGWRISPSKQLLANKKELYNYIRDEFYRDIEFPLESNVIYTGDIQFTSDKKEAILDLYIDTKYKTEPIQKMTLHLTQT